MAICYSSAELKDIGAQSSKRLLPATTALAMFEYEMRRAAESESLFHGAVIQAAKAAKEVDDQQSRIESLENTIKHCANHHNNEHTVSVPGSTHMFFTISLADHFTLTQSALSHAIPPSSSRAKLISAVNSIVDGLKSFSPEDSNPKAVLKRTHWLANELDQESISTEDKVALTTILSAIHVHETKMDLQRAVKHLRDDFLTVQSDLLEAQRRISKLEDNVRALTLQRTAAPESSKLAQRIEVTSSDGQTLDLSVPKGKALVPLKSSSRATSPTPSSTNSGTLDDEKTEHTAEDHLCDTADAFQQSADNEKSSLHAAQQAKQPNVPYRQSAKQNDLVAVPATFSAKNKSKNEQGGHHSSSAQATTSTEKKHHENTFSGNDKLLPPVPAAQAFPQFNSNRTAWQRQQAPTDVDQDRHAFAQKEILSSATPTWGVSSPSASTAELAKSIISSAAQTSQIVNPVRSKSKATKWKDPPLFQETEPTSAPNSFQAPVSPSFRPFNANGQSKSSTGNSTNIQEPLSQVSQHPDLKQTPLKTFTPNENTRQLGSIMKVLQENKKLDENKPLQKNPAKPPVFASADAMMEMIRSVAPDSGFHASAKPVVALASEVAHPPVSFAIPTAKSLVATQAIVPQVPFTASIASPSVASRAEVTTAAILQVPHTTPTAGPSVASRADFSTPSSDSSTSQMSFLEVPKTLTKKRNSAVKLVKPETELSFSPRALSSTSQSPIKQEKPTEASLPASSSGPTTPPGQTATGTRDSTSPSTATSSSPLTPAPTPTIKVTQPNKVIGAGVPAFHPSASTETSSSPKEMSLADRLKSQMTPNMLALFDDNMKRAL